MCISVFFFFFIYLKWVDTVVAGLLVDIVTTDFEYPPGIRVGWLRVPPLGGHPWVLAGEPHRGHIFVSTSRR